MAKLSEHEKETSINFTEGGREAVIKTFNVDLKHRLAEFAKKFPLFCHLDNFTEEGSVTYVMDKSRLSIRLIPPSGEDIVQQQKPIQRNMDSGLYGREKKLLKMVTGCECWGCYFGSNLERCMFALCFGWR